MPLLRLIEVAMLSARCARRENSLKRPLVILGCTLACFSAFASEPQRASLATEGFYEQFRAILADSQIPGAAYAIIADGRIVEQRGIGVRGLGDLREVNAHTVFRTASVSKTFAAQVVAGLVRQRRLQWDTPVSEFAPNLHFESKDHVDAMRLEHLLSHTTGAVPNAFDNLVEAGRPVDEILPEFRSLKPICSVGTCYAYQNLLFSLVESAIEQQTGRAYEDEVRETIFKPLGMSDASFGLASYLAADNRARPHVSEAGIWVATPLMSRYYQLPSAAGVNASANDLARWLLAQMGANPNVVDEEDTSTLTTTRVRTPRIARRAGWNGAISDAYYGLGWRIYAIGGERIYGHTGLLRGFSAEIAYSPKHNLGIVVLMNGDSSPTLSRISAAFWIPALTLRLSAPRDNISRSRDSDCSPTLLLLTCVH